MVWETLVTVRLASQNQFSVNQGVLIIKVTAGGPGEQAGLKEGDIIVQIDNTVVTDLSEFNNYELSQESRNTGHAPRLPGQSASDGDGDAGYSETAVGGIISSKFPYEHISPNEIGN